MDTAHEKTRGLTMTESDILYQRGDFWITRTKTAYIVWQDGPTHATSRALFKANPDGLSLVRAYVRYLADCAARKVPA